jgi:hypothetical protein
VILADASLAPSIEKAGDRIGRYKLLQQIGEGGMGLVYMAEQDQPVRRSVALKVIKLGMDTRQVVARFEAERQALAMMNHPHIAKVFDAGATDSGRPYFVMELVRGIPITEYCDKNFLPTRQRLDLFILVCQAVQHAHQKGVIHRDLKPSNILVTLNDGVPWPMIIDFGIAKATNQRLTEKTLFTHFEQMIGTPAYMSPEQAEMSKLDVDTRTDIYALGVLLYQLLTGRPPFSAGSQSELEELHLHAPPPAPSHLAPVPAALDAVVRRCLAKRPADRYPETVSLLEDVRRALEPSTRPAGRTLGLGLYLRARPEAGEAAEDAALDALDQVLEAARDGLPGCGLAIVVEGADFLMAAAPVPAGEADARAWWQQVRGELDRLWPALERQVAGLGVLLTAALHVAEAVVEPGPGGEPRVVDGPLLRQGEWTTGEGRAGIFITREALALLSGPSP